MATNDFSGVTVAFDVASYIRGAVITLTVSGKNKLPSGEEDVTITTAASGQNSRVYTVKSGSSGHSMTAVA